MELPEPLPIAVFMKSPEAQEPPKALLCTVDFSAATEWELNLLLTRQLARIASLRSVYVDTRKCASEVTMEIRSSQQTLVFPPGVTGWTPVLCSLDIHLTFRGTSPDVLKIHLLNIDIDPSGGIGGGSPVTVIPVSDLLFFASPRLAGRTTAGPGAGEEISVSPALTLAGLTLGTEAITGDVAIAADGVVSTIQPNAVTNAKLAQGAARTVKANPTNALANFADLAGGGAGTVLTDTGVALQFLAPALPGANTVPLTSLANAAAQFDIVGRKTAGAGAWEDSTRSQLNLAGTDLGNIFILPQIINNSGQIAPTPIVLGLQLAGANTRLQLDTINANGSITFQRTQTSFTAPTALTTGQTTGAINWGGYQGSAYNAAAAQINSYAIENWSPTANGSSIGFEVTPAGSTARAVGMALRGGGGLTLGAASDIGAGTINSPSAIRCGQFTFATLPAAAVVGAGARAFITNSPAAPVFGAAAAGGGALGINVTSDGAIWRNG